MSTSATPVVLITGAAKRIGRSIAETLHQQGYAVVLHYQHSENQAKRLAHTLNQERSDSAISFAADLSQPEACQQLAEKAIAQWGRLDCLVNNASRYFATPIHSISPNDWDDLIGSNLKAPSFLSAACAATLKRHQGNIINLIDSNVLHRPIKNHCLYTAAKAGLHGLTLALAQDLAPQVRVNGIAPGAMLWAENESDSEWQQKTIQQTALGRSGSVADIAHAVAFLAQADYITGQVIKVDGGKNIGD